jgi:tRNA(Arg) A34 adenosine deaminase TadA
MKFPKNERLATFMRRAIELAHGGVKSGDGGPFGAVIIKDDRIVGEGWNRVVADNDPTAHGEISAIRDACRRLKTFDLSGCEIFTTGEPCPMCLAAIYWARIKAIYFGFSIHDAAGIGFDDKFIFDEFTRPAEKRMIRQVQILKNEALALAEEFVSNPDHVKY